MDAVRHIHSRLELAAIVCFLLLAFFDALAHWTKSKEKEHTFGAIGIVFFFVAVSCEFAGYIYGQRNDTLSENVIISLDQKANDASDKAAEALTDSTNAIAQAGVANAQSGIAVDSASNAKTLATGARKEAEELRKENLELSKKVRPRTISPDKKDALLNSLKALPKGPVLVGYDFLDDEAGLCATEILNPLVNAGFPARFIYGKNSAWGVLNLGLVGINVVVKDSSSPPAHTLGIVKSFAEAGLPPMRIFDDKFDRNNDLKFDDGAIVIWCGRKP